MNDYEKELIIKQANMYLDGMSLREIAKKVQQSHVTVRRNLLVKLKEVDISLYTLVSKKLNASAPVTSEDAIRDPEVIKRVLSAYKKCVEENKTVLEIAGELGSTEFTIYRDLTKRLVDFHQIDPLIVTEEMLENVAFALDRRKRENLLYEKKLENVFDIRYLDKMYPTFEKKIKFMGKCALTFGLRLDVLSELMGMDKDRLYSYFLSNCKNSNSLHFLFYHGFRNQSDALTDFKKFFVRLTKAYVTGDKNKVVSILEEILDIKANNFKKEHENGKKITDEDIVTLVKWQVKYGVSSDVVAATFNISKGYYNKRVLELEETYPALLSDYFYVEDYYQKNNRKGVVHG